MDSRCLICALEWNNERKLLPRKIIIVEQNAIIYTEVETEGPWTTIKMFSKIFWSNFVFEIYRE